MATSRGILKKTLLPGIIPRILSLFKSGFVQMAYCIALVYANVRLLPPNHPYLNPQNIGSFGIRHVIAEAANNLVFKRQNIDQIFIFFLIMAGFVLIIMQFGLLAIALLAEQPALALGILNVTELFENPNTATGSQGPAQDIAFILMDRVFGVKGFFDSCVSDTAVACLSMDGVTPYPTPTTYPFAFHIGLHKILQFYSNGIFLVGVMVIIYFVIAVTAETAQTGMPFGQRFNKAWVPVRFILFFALIMPINIGQDNEGFNLAQLITFKVVQMGSNFASNGWAFFNNGSTAGGPLTPGLSDSYMTQQYDMIATPNVPDITELVHTMFVARTCATAYHFVKGTEDGFLIDAYVIRQSTPGLPSTVNGGAGVLADSIPLETTTYIAARDFSYNGNLTIRFGERLRPGSQLETDKGDEYRNYAGGVKPYCGDVTIQIQSQTQPAAEFIFNQYYNMMQGMWLDTNQISRARCIAYKYINSNLEPNCTPQPTEAWATSQTTAYQLALVAYVQGGINQQRALADFDVNANLISRGWAGASIWYNRIADMNGAVTAAAYNIPKSSKAPWIYEIAAKSAAQENEMVTSAMMNNQAMASRLGLNTLLDIEEGEREILQAMNYANGFWKSKSVNNFQNKTDHILIDFINAVMGTSGIFEMRKNTNVHPLAQLSALGKGMMEAVSRNAAYGLVLSGATSLGFTMGDITGDMVGVAKGFFFTMVMTTMAMSAILYYVLPFLPFIYFLFAISGWIKSIFEAIVAMPLWALAHLRIDGEGISGPGATNGYFLLLEIFLRPILILFGFVASISIFSALVSVLNQIFDLVVGNVGGFDNEFEQTGALIQMLDVARNPIDEFFYTAMYVIICYLIGMSCFKLVDNIPNSILRWIGSSVPTMQEQSQDPAGKLSSQVFRGTNLLGNQMRGKMGGDVALM